MDLHTPAASSFADEQSTEKLQTAPDPSGSPYPAAALAFRLAQAKLKSPVDLIYVAGSPTAAEQIALALAGFAPNWTVLHLPAWDCLPYDRAMPSLEIMGSRMAVLQRLLDPSETPRILVTSPEAALQRLPPAKHIRGQMLRLAVGDPLDRDAFERFVAGAGYRVDESVDEPGEVAMRGNVIDVFAADATAPVRITDQDGTIEAITAYDPVTQRSSDERTRIELRPASELIGAAEENNGTFEHAMLARYGTLETIFDYLPKADLLVEPTAQERIATLDEQIAEAYATASSFGENAHLTAPDQFYLDSENWHRDLGDRKPFDLDRSGLAGLPDFLSDRNPGRAAAGFIAAQIAADNNVLLCSTPDGQKRLRALLQRNNLAAQDFAGDIGDLEPGAGIYLAGFPVGAGFLDTSSRFVVIAATDIFGTSIDIRETGPQLSTTLDLRVGDVVVHEDHGVAILSDLTRIEADGIEQDTIRLQYHADATLMVPVQDFGKLWRYGAEADAVKLDRLNTKAWAKKRAEVSAEIDEAAKALAQLAAERLQASARIIEPPRAAYQRLVRRFPYAETPDQAAAIAAVLADLASGHPMNRLICGDVGFGKTEIALRAAAAVALAGQQVALVAPTTVLARQHLHSFERRFAGTDIAVGHVSRLNTPAENAAVKERLASGEIRIVIATHAIAADDVHMPQLGLVIIDEEQRFGAKLKHQLETLARDVHLLSMSATPIPRTLQAAMVGLQDVSVIATPPARRRPVRTLLLSYDAATARTALLREKRRGGQSFCVVPRIDDIDIVAAELARIVPELVVGIAHGDLPAKAIDTALLEFANGAGDILLATNIVESGLDVPRANTMLIWRADRFGLGQLHQLRGRVGRGRTQAVTYLLTDPDEGIAEATKARLATLEAFDRLGAGFDIAARDLELRGAGDLLGEDQAGHVSLIGAGLYGQLLEQALAKTKGQIVELTRPAELNLGLSGLIPVGYVPEPPVRINLYARLQRFAKPDDIADFADELEDRFGERPPEVETLLALTRLALQAGALDIERIDAGPKAIAITPRKKSVSKKLVKLSANRLHPSNDRLTADRDGSDDVLAELASMLGLAK